MPEVSSDRVLSVDVYKLEIVEIGVADIRVPILEVKFEEVRHLSLWKYVRSIRAGCESGVVRLSRWCRRQSRY